LGEEEKEVGTLYKNLLYLFLISWLVYPILFIIGGNGGILKPSTYLEIISVPLEWIAKGVAGVVVCPSRVRTSISYARRVCSA
jgi:bacteriorhodopsin